MTFKCTLGHYANKRFVERIPQFHAEYRYGHCSHIYADIFSDELMCLTIMLYRYAGINGSQWRREERKTAQLEIRNINQSHSRRKQFRGHKFQWGSRK